MALGVTVRDVDQVTPASAPTDTGQWFAAGLTDRGSTITPGRVTNLNQFTRRYGPRVSYSPLHDAVETFFREGGGVVHIIRVAGPGAAAASTTLDDATAGPSLTVDAASTGAWGDSLTVEVADGDSPGSFVLIVALSGTEVERSPDLDSVDAAAAWADDSAYVRVTAAGEDNPAVTGPAALTGGDDDRASITDSEWEAALERFGRDLGPGQVSAPGRTTTTAHQQLIAHAVDHNRIALLDGPDSSSPSVMTAAAAGLSGLDAARFAGMFAPWVRVPGVAAATTRIVPPSALMAGLMARNDAAGSPNHPAAGENGIARWALGPEHTFTDSEYEDLNEAGVNMLRLINGQLRAYGYRSLESRAAMRWWMLSNGRLRMLIQAQLEVIGERYMFRQVDGKGVTLASLAGEITGTLLEHFNAGALYGAIPEEAFRVDVGPGVNPPEQLATGQVNAVAVIRPSPFGEEIVIELVRRSITEPV